jgi:large subunit ribosomal protein L22
MKYQYSVKEVKENMAKAVGISMPVSYKHCVEICSFIRGKNVETAKKMLEEVIAIRSPVPFKKFTTDVGHRKGGIGSGRFPEKAATEIKKLIESAQKNAQFKGLSTSNLKITHISAKQGESGWHYGRHLRRRIKRSHVELILEESGKDAVKEKPAKKPKQEKTKKRIKND